MWNDVFLHCYIAESYFSHHFCVQVIGHWKCYCSLVADIHTHTVIHLPPVRSCGSHVMLANAQKEPKMRKEEGAKKTLAPNHWHTSVHTRTHTCRRTDKACHAESSFCKWPIKYEWYRAIFLSACLRICMNWSSKNALFLQPQHSFCMLCMERRLHMYTFIVCLACMHTYLQHVPAYVCLCVWI